MMTKNTFKSLLIILSVMLFFTACEKEKNIENFDSISGILSIGENMSNDAITEVGVILAKVGDGIHLSEITTETDEIELIKMAVLNADGSFAFENLEKGNYLIALSEGFSFSNKDFLTAVVDGNTPNLIEQIVDRLEVDNGNKNYNWKIKNLTNYSVSSVSFYYDGQLYKTIDKSMITNGEFSVSLDRKKEVTLRVECLNGEYVLLSNPVEFFGLASACNIFTENPNGDLNVLAYLWFKRRITLRSYRFDDGMGA